MALTRGFHSDEQKSLQWTAFLKRLQQLGWSDGGNIRFDTRWGADELDRERKYAAELVALTPDVILASGTLSTGALQHVSGTLPIVFVAVIDPVSAGFVDSLARPGNNMTGFMLFEYSLSGKWLELLKQMAPNVKRVAVLRDPAIASNMAEFATVQAMAESLGVVEVSAISMRDAGELERGVVAVR